MSGLAAAGLGAFGFDGGAGGTSINPTGGAAETGDQTGAGINTGKTSRVGGITFGDFNSKDPGFTKNPTAMALVFGLAVLVIFAIRKG